METRLVIAYTLIALLLLAAAVGLFRFATRHQRRDDWQHRHVRHRRARRRY